MKKIYKISTQFIIMALILVPFTVFARNTDTNSGNSTSVIRSIWKYEQDQTKYSPEDGVAKKIYYLSLNSDGTYHQFVQVVPISPQDYFRVKNYAVDGKWTEKNGKLILNEYGKENAIDYNFLYSNFENIDNQYIIVKK